MIKLIIQIEGVHLHLLHPDSATSGSKEEGELTVNEEGKSTVNMSLQWVAEQLSDAMEISYRLPLVHEKLTNLALSFFSH